MNDKQANCEERIDAELADTLETLRALWESYCNGKGEHGEYGSIYEYGLSFDYVPPAYDADDPEPGYFRYQISTGGPGDEFRFRADRSYNDHWYRPYSIQYWFLDWFDGAHRELRGEDRALLAQIFEWFSECETTEHAHREATE